MYSYLSYLFFLSQSFLVNGFNWEGEFTTSYDRWNWGLRRVLCSKYELMEYKMRFPITFPSTASEIRLSVTRKRKRTLHRRGKGRVRIAEEEETGRKPRKRMEGRMGFGIEKVRQTGEKVYGDERSPVGGGEGGVGGGRLGGGLKL